MALGARITGVDDATFTAQGEPYSAVVLPNSESNVASTLQADDVSLGAPRPLNPCCPTCCRHRRTLVCVRSVRVRESSPQPRPPARTPVPWFCSPHSRRLPTDCPVCVRRQAKKFPGYTSDNLAEKGVSPLLIPTPTTYAATLTLSCPFVP